MLKTRITSDTVGLKMIEQSRIAVCISVVVLLLLLFVCLFVFVVVVVVKDFFP